VTLSVIAPGDTNL